MYGINTEAPQIMHIDLNSAFATTEQQAHPSLCVRPMGITNCKPNKYSCVIAALYEAKALGIKVGTRLDEALAICPKFIHSPSVQMKSIDEGIIDFHGTLGTIHQRSLVAIGREIKQRIRTELGCWMRVNIGIGPNRFLANKPPDCISRTDWTSLTTPTYSLSTNPSNSPI